MSLIFIVCMGEYIFSAIGIPVPQVLKDAQENKWTWLISLFFIGNGVASALKQTGAFEIYVDGNLVFSKLESGDMVNAYQLQAIFEPLGVNFLKVPVK